MLRSSLCHPHDLVIFGSDITSILSPPCPASTGQQQQDDQALPGLGTQSRFHCVSLFNGRFKESHVQIHLKWIKVNV